MCVWSLPPLGHHTVDSGHRTSRAGLILMRPSPSPPDCRFRRVGTGSAATIMLSLQAHTGGSELGRLQLHPDGTRKAIL